MLQFDIRGLLLLNERNNITLEEFEVFFVKGFDKSEHRQQLLGHFLRYMNAFQQEICSNFTLWINGSFVTRKFNPRDIDFVTLLDFETAHTHEQLLRDKFLKSKALQNFNLDAYLVEVFPEDHPKSFLTKSDLAYWNSWFTRTSENRQYAVLQRVLLK